jgi:hypothetical protein
MKGRVKEASMELANLQRAPLLRLRSRKFMLGAFGALLVLLLGGAVVIGWGATQAASPVSPVSMGATVVSVDGSTIVFSITGPSGPEKLSGSKIVTRVGRDTQFMGMSRESLRPLAEVVITIDANANADGSYRLLDVSRATVR